MSFLNWMLLGGAAAFTLPLLIHLLNRSRFQLVDWGAMHLLESALQSNSRRVQWQSLLLLLVRCAIPILLALALARPVLTHWRITGSGGDKSLVLLIDNSFSMDRASLQEATCFDVAIKQATEIINKQTTATEFSIWSLGGTPTDILSGTTFDRRRALAKLQTIRSGAGSVSVRAALAAGLKQSQTMQNANREIIVIGDFQSGDWNQFDASEQAAWKAQLDAESMRPRLSLIKIDAQNADVEANISTSWEALELPLIVAGQSFPITTQVRNHGPTAVEDVAVVLQVGGVKLASRRVAIPGAGRSQVVFACQIDAPGEHAIEIRVADAKGLQADNQVIHIVDVREAIRVLLIDNQPSAPLLKRSSGYLTLALSPFQAGDASRNYAITHTLAANQIKQEILSGHDVIVLSNIQRLDNQASEAVASFVHAGGGLLIFAGDSLDLNWYNSQWGHAAKSPLLPATFVVSKKGTAKADANARNTAPAKIQNSQIAHPALKAFSSPGAGDLNAVEIRQFAALQLDDSDANATSLDEDDKNKVEDIKPGKPKKISGVARAGSQVLMRLETDDPLLVAKEYGEGKVVLLATAADEGWSNFPSRPAYVPLMQGLVQWLASRSDVRHNIMTGETLALALSGADNAEDKTPVSEPSEVTLIQPNLLAINRQFPEGSTVSFDETAFPGLYRMQRGQGQRDALFAVNVSPSESETQTLDQAQVQKMASDIGATVAPTAVSYFEQEGLRNNGRELWRILMLGLVAFLFIELWLQQRISRGATS